MIAAFMYLVLGLGYTFFGAKYAKYFLSLLSGLTLASIPFIFVSGSVSTGLSIASFAIFVLVTFACFRLEKIHSAVVGLNVGIYLGSLAYSIILSYFTKFYYKFIVEFLTALICCYYGYNRTQKYMVHATSFLGANMIATSITLFTADAAGSFGNSIIQVGCILLFGLVGHYVQMKLGYEKYQEEQINAAAN